VAALSGICIFKIFLTGTGARRETLVGDDILYMGKLRGLRFYSTALEEAIHKATYYESIWQRLLNQLTSLSGKLLVGTTYGQTPCYSAFINVRQATRWN
jgi:hypothetical protein